MDASKDCVLAIKPLCWGQCDEELRSVCVGAGIGHGQDPFLHLKKNNENKSDIFRIRTKHGRKINLFTSAGVFEIRMDFVGECMTINWWTTTTCASCDKTNENKNRIFFYSHFHHFLPRILRAKAGHNWMKLTWITALYHKIGNNTMENRVVIVTSAH